MTSGFYQTLAYDEAAVAGAQLVDEYFADMNENVLFWSPVSFDLPTDTALVYGNNYGPNDPEEAFKGIVRTFLERTGCEQLSYVDYSGGGGDPLWVMLIKPHYNVDLEAGVHICRTAAYSRTLKELLQHPRYPKRRLNSVLKLLIDGYPNCDLMSPLDKLIPPTLTESSTAAPVAAERHDATRGSFDE